MAFPTIDHPTYTVDLSIGRVTYRPFLVREQKLFMMAHNADNVDDTINTIKTVANNCIISPKVDIDALPLVDLSLLFIHLRARSMGEKMKVYFKCQNDFEDKPCGMIIESEVDLLALKPTGGGANNRIMLTDDIGVQMHYPSFDLLNLMLKAPSLESEFIMIAGCIDFVFDKHGIHNASEASPEEVQRFITNLPEGTYNKLKEFIATSPTIKKEIKEQCIKCKYTHNIVLEGLSDFFV